MLLAGCGNYGTQSYRVRVTVEAETPDGIKRGSSVMEVLSAKRLQIFAEGGAGASDLRGEAVVIETRSGPLFILLKHPGGTLQGAMTVALAPEADDGGIDAYVGAIRKLGGWFADYKAELPRQDWPLMVRFRDINDPTSVEPVEPGRAGIKRILLETTDDEISTGLKRRLAWLQDGGLTLDPSGGPTFNPTFPQTIYQREFSTEIPR